MSVDSAEAVFIKSYLTLFSLYQISDVGSRQEPITGEIIFLFILKAGKPDS